MHFKSTIQTSYFCEIDDVYSNKTGEIQKGDLMQLWDTNQYICINERSQYFICWQSNKNDSLLVQTKQV